jgi:hypothetical protein
MSLQLGPRRVVAPDGAQWRVGRTWTTRRPRLPRRPRGAVTADSVQSIGSGLPELVGLDLGQELLAFAAVVAVVLVLIPLLFFGLELIVLGVVLASGVIARTLLGRPWVVQATTIDAVSAGRALEWRVRGWRRSQDLIARVTAELAAGHDPSAVQPRR